MHNYHDILKNIRQQVAQNQLEKALQDLGEVVINVKHIKNNKTLNNSLININGQFSSYKRSIGIGLLSAEEKSRIENNLRDSILSFISEVEAKIERNPGLEAQSTFYNIRTISILCIVLLAISGGYYYLIQSEANNQKAWIAESGLVVILESASQIDTITTTHELMKIVDCKYENHVIFSLKFNLLNSKNLEYDNLVISLKQSFVDKNDNWNIGIEGWERKYDSENQNSAIYQYVDHPIRDPIFSVESSNIQ